MTRKKARSRFAWAASTWSVSRLRRARNAIAVTPMSSMTRVPSMNGAPRIAPTPISSASALFVKRIATTGMSVSGVAVPSAARMLPVAPSLIRSLIPSHSTPFVKTSAPTRIRTKAPTMNAASIGFTVCSRLGGRLRRRDARDGRGAARPQRAEERDEHEHEGGQHEGRREAAVEEVERTPVPGDEGLPQLALRRVAENEGHDERREGVLHLAEPVADDAEHDRDEDVEHAVVQRVRADDRDDHDERGDDRVGHPHDHRKERHREQAEDEREQVAQVDARDETPDEVGVLDEEHGSRLQTPHEEPGHDHSRRR